MKKRIAIITPQIDAPTESFIQCHIEFLEGDKLVYHGADIPNKLNGQGLYKPPGLASRAFIKIQNRLKRETLQPKTKAFQDSLIAEKPDVILIEYGHIAAQVIDVIKPTGIPIIVHFHGYDSAQYELLARYQKEYKRVFAYASRIVAVSNAMRERLINLGAPADRVVYSCYGPHPDFAMHRIEFTSSRQLLALGRFVDKKSPHLTLFAFSKVLKDFPDARLVMIGEGSLLPMCKDIVRFLDIENNVVFTGALKRQDIIEHMKNSLAFVQHSRTAEDGDREGTPVAVIESQLFGLPVIATKHEGIADVVVHNETGFLVDEGDWMLMSEYMKKVLSDFELARTMSSNARKRIESKFLLSHHIDTLNNLIDDVIRQRLPKV
jgi:glycosyltransferase involved in cell wall biosynthesis